MKKWLDKYKEAENGIEATMDGLTDQGFNYNGAWGGTMQMGGNLPGSVGFMYARTQNPAPSNGPYAKKTKASAQDGRAVSDNTRLKPIVTEKPINRESVKSTNKSYVMSPQEALLNKLKGKNLKESQDRLNKTAEKLTAIGSLSPNPLISVPSSIGNFTLGAMGTPTAEDRGLDYMGVFGSLATPDYASGFKKVSRRVPFFKGLSFVDALADIFEFTPSEDLPKRQNGGEMKYYQEGLDWKPKNISQDGIKVDPMGYWNPDNVGEPVIIPSNEITMEGVYEPLIGISDTGDVQYMEPGEEYEFDGESVTEYPIMQKGGRAPIYVDNPNDPRLKAFKDSASVYNDFLRLKKMMDSKYSSNEDYYVKKEDYPRNPDGSICYNCIKKEAERKKAKDQFYSKDKQGFTQLVDPNIDPGGYINYLKDNPVFDESVGKFQDYSNARPKQPVYYKKPDQKNDSKESGYDSMLKKFGFTNDDVQRAYKTKPVVNKGDVYYNVNKGGKQFRIHTQSGGFDYIEEIKQPKAQKKAEPAQVAPKQQPAEPPIERKQNIYEGSPVYSPGIGSGLPSALIGFANQKGDTSYIKPEDYERFAVPKYAKEYIETKKKKNGGWLDAYEN